MKITPKMYTPNNRVAAVNDFHQRGCAVCVYNNNKRWMELDDGSSFNSRKIKKNINNNNNKKMAEIIAIEFVGWTNKNQNQPVGRYQLDFGINNFGFGTFKVDTQCGNNH
jgi:hypothetical protein